MRAVVVLVGTVSVFVLLYRPTQMSARKLAIQLNGGPMNSARYNVTGYLSITLAVLSVKLQKLTVVFRSQLPHKEVNYNFD